MPHSNPWLSASSSVAFGSHAYDGVGEMDAQKLNLAPVTFGKAYICSTVWDSYLGFISGGGSVPRWTIQVVSRSLGTN